MKYAATRPKKYQDFLAFMVAVSSSSLLLGDVFVANSPLLVMLQFVDPNVRYLDDGHKVLTC
jgi:hypothetical protein